MKAERKEIHPEFHELELTEITVQEAYILRAALQEMMQRPHDPVISKRIKHMFDTIDQQLLHMPG